MAKEIIRNADPEDLERLRGDSVKTFKQHDPQPLSEENKYKVPMKSKRSYFEPEPVKFKLPSGSKFVDKSLLTENNEIYVRRLTSVEEGMFSKIKNESTLNETITAVIDNIIKSDIDVNDLSLIDKMSIFIFAVCLTYGSKIDLKDKINCKTCANNKDITVTVDLIEDIEWRSVPDDYEYPFVINIETYGTDIKMVFRFPSVAEEDILEKKEIVDLMYALTENITGTKPNGNPVNKLEWKDLIANLDMRDKKKFSKKFAEFRDFGIVLKTTNYKCSYSKCQYMKDKVEIIVGLDAIIDKISKSISESIEE